MTARTGDRRRTRPQGGGFSDLLDIAAVEPRGLIVTSSGRYVRLLALDRVPNLFSASDQQRDDALGARQELCASIPDGQELAFMVCRDPLPAEQVGASDARAVRDAARRDLDRGDHESARARLRLAAMTAATIELAANGEQGASFARHYAFVIWTPLADGLRERVDDLFSRRQEQARVVDFGRHYEAASASAEFANQVASNLGDQGVAVRRVDGPEALELIWERLHPAAGPHPRPDRLREVCAPVLEQTGRTAARRRARLIDALCEGFEELDIPAATIDDRDPRFVRHGDGTLEEVVYLSRQPQLTDPWWLDPLSLTSLSSTVVVRIRPHERSFTRLKVTANARRKNDAIETQHRKGGRVTREDLRVAEEVEAVEDEMQQVAGATLYSVAVYASLRSTSGDEDALRRTAKLRASEYMVRRDARLMRGRRTSLRGLFATLPLARDPLGRTTKWAHRDTGNLVPLSSSRCGHDEGLPLGISLPHGTLERLDPFDRSAGTHVTVVTGGSGTGKTFTTNALLLRAIARGMHGVIIDRSSTAAGDGGRAASHYDPLLALVPGSARVSIGSGPASVRINPWEVDDPAAPPIERIEALLAIHALLIGDAAVGSDTDRRLSADDTALLRNAIQAVYEGCAADEREPTESLLVDELLARLSNEDDETMAARITSLVVRLEAYVGDGMLAFLLDEPTNVPAQSPLLLFDIAGVPEALLPAVLMIAMTYIDAEAQRLHTKRLSEPGRPAAYSDHLFAEIEEGWKITDTRVGAAWLNEEARRSRHLAFWLIFVTQQLTDLQGEGGEALLGQAATLIIHKSKPGTVEPVADAAELSAADLAQIRGLSTRKGEFADAFVTTAAGRGRIRIALSAPEFWAIAADPDRDQPARRRALEESGGDPYAAIALLADQGWHLRA